MRYIAHRHKVVETRCARAYTCYTIRQAPLALLHWICFRVKGKADRRSVFLSVPVPTVRPPGGGQNLSASCQRRSINEMKMYCIYSAVRIIRGGKNRQHIFFLFQQARKTFFILLLASEKEPPVGEKLNKSGCLKFSRVFLLYTHTHTHEVAGTKDYRPSH